LVKRFGSPWVIRNAELAINAFTVPPAPDTFWQSAQWHWRSSVIGTVTS
jgi:hypothetical protein